MPDLTGAGLGLDYGAVALVPARAEWQRVGRALSSEVARTLGDLARAVEPVGSTAIPGLLAKPIVDLAVGVPGVPDPDGVTGPLESAGWLYRGDAGEDGGLIFVLEARPHHRVAHVHVVGHGGTQWRRYLSFRDLLLSDPEACARYESTKRALQAAHPCDQRAYTAGKSSTVESILGTDSSPDR